MRAVVIIIVYYGCNHVVYINTPHGLHKVYCVQPKATSYIHRGGCRIFERVVLK